MDNQSVRAYDLPERLRGYDADMDIMHPLRWKMIDLALDFLPFPASRPLRALDLGVGTGAFTQRLLERYPQARQPQTLQSDLEILREAGIATLEVLWKEYREAAVGGSKPG